MDYNFLANTICFIIIKEGVYEYLFSNLIVKVVVCMSSEEQPEIHGLFVVHKDGYIHRFILDAGRGNYILSPPRIPNFPIHYCLHSWKINLLSTCRSVTYIWITFTTSLTFRRNLRLYSVLVPLFLND